MDFSAASFAVIMSDVRAVADSALIMFLISVASLFSGVVSVVAPLVTAVPSIPVNRSLRFPRLSLACCELVIMEDVVVLHREATRNARRLGHRIDERPPHVCGGGLNEATGSGSYS